MKQLNAYSFHFIFIKDKGNDFKNDSSGNEGCAGNTDPEAPSSDPQNTGSPPKEKETNNDKRTRLFRVSSGTPSNKKKQSLTLTAEPTKSVLETCLSPTNVEPRKLLLEQLMRTFSTEEAILPDVVTIIGPPESYTSGGGGVGCGFGRIGDSGFCNSSNIIGCGVNSITIAGCNINGTTLFQRLTPILATSFRPTFSPHNTAEVKAVLQALMNKIHKQ